MKKEKLIKANLELQSRISKLEAEISKLKIRNSELSIENDSLTLTNNTLVRKLDNKEKVIKKYQNIKPTVERVNLVSNLKALKNIDNKNKVNLKDRQKKIYGILKNQVRYNLTQTEIKFLTSIKNIKQLTPKQQSWYNDIVQKGKQNQKEYKYISDTDREIFKKNSKK